MGGGGGGGCNWAIGQNYFVSLQPCGKYLVYSLFEQLIATITTKKVHIN